MQPTPPWMQPTHPAMQPTPPVMQPTPPVMQPTPPVMQPTPPVMQPTPPVMQPTLGSISWICRLARGTSTDVLVMDLPTHGDFFDFDVGDHDQRRFSIEKKRKEDTCIANSFLAGHILSNPTFWLAFSSRNREGCALGWKAKCVCPLVRPSISVGTTVSLGEGIASSSIQLGTYPYQERRTKMII